MQASEMHFFSGFKHETKTILEILQANSSVANILSSFGYLKCCNNKNRTILHNNWQQQHFLPAFIVLLFSFSGTSFLLSCPPALHASLPLLLYHPLLSLCCPLSHLPLLFPLLLCLFFFSTAKCLRPPSDTCLGKNGDEEGS